MAGISQATQTQTQIQNQSQNQNQNQPQNKPRAHTTAATTRASLPPDSGARLAESDRKAASTSAVLRAVLEHGPVARSTIARLTGLSPAAVTGHCACLAGLGLVRDLPGQIQSNGAGRPHVPVDLAAGRHLAAAVHIAVPGTTVALVDLRGRVVAQEFASHPDTEPARVAQRAADALRGLLRSHGAGVVPIGLGVAAGGWVDRDSGTIVEHPMLGWRDVPIRQLLAERTGLPVFVDGHARALLHGERFFGQAGHGRSVLYLFVGNMVDAAFATRDQAHYGRRSQAGAIAHFPVADSRARCPCGRTGCLQAAVSERVVLQRAHEAGIIAEPVLAQLVDAAVAGHRGAVELFLERGRLVGRAAAMLVDVLSPDLVIVAEPGAAALPEVVEVMRAELAGSSRTSFDVARGLVPTSFPNAAVLAMAGGSIVLDALYRDPLGLLGQTGQTRREAGDGRRQATDVALGIR